MQEQGLGTISENTVMIGSVSDMFNYMGSCSGLFMSSLFQQHFSSSHIEMLAPPSDENVTQKRYAQTETAVSVQTNILLCSRLLWRSGKASASRAEDIGFESRLRRDFFGVDSYQ